MGQGAEGNV